MEISRNNYVFCYGSNHPAQLARRLKVPLVEVLERSKACTLYDYQRAFMGLSKKWVGSVATLIPKEKGQVRGFAYLMTQEEEKRIDMFEAYPVKYDKVEVILHDHNQVPFIGIAYIMNPSEFFLYPNKKYLNACALSYLAYYYIGLDNDKLKDFNPGKLSIPVINAISGDKVDVFTSQKLELPHITS